MKMTFYRMVMIIRISEAETHLLLAFGMVFTKEDIIHFVWENRGGCVSESVTNSLIK